MSPLEIHILLHLYASPAPLSENMPNDDSPAAQDVLKRFEAEGLIEDSHDNDSGWSVTERAEVYIDAICSVPWPVQKWVMPND